MSSSRFQMAAAMFSCKHEDTTNPPEFEHKELCHKGISFELLQFACFSSLSSLVDNTFSRFLLWGHNAIVLGSAKLATFLAVLEIFFSAVYMKLVDYCK